MPIQSAWAGVSVITDSISMAPAHALCRATEGVVLARPKINTALSLARQSELIGRRAVFSRGPCMFAKDRWSFPGHAQATAEEEQGGCQAICTDLAQCHFGAE